MSRSTASVAKRLLDVLAASAGIVLLAPVGLAVGLLVRVALGRPVLFRQLRAGLGGRPFTLLKFRTMREARTARESDGERLTAVGRWLRGWSLDELPQLVNILRGDMSLVGPRPLFLEYVPLYSPEQARRLEARPGLTGWAQVNGRNSTTWEQRFEHDLWYLDHWSLALDLRILALTAMRVVRRDGVAQPGVATMERFRGNA